MCTSDLHIRPSANLTKTIKSKKLHLQCPPDLLARFLKMSKNYYCCSHQSFGTSGLITYFIVHAYFNFLKYFFTLWTKKNKTKIVTCKSLATLHTKSVLLARYHSLQMLSVASLESLSFPFRNFHPFFLTERFQFWWIQGRSRLHSMVKIYLLYHLFSDGQGTES